jgi:stearoyl-CoA desaturase (delta-9 desaturase)
MASENQPADVHDDIIYPSAIPFLLVHLACFGAIWSGVTWEAAILGISLYWLRIFAIGAGYHRLFSHRAYSTSRAFQFVLAVLCQSTAQKSVLWWAAKHRHHHLHSDTELDTHSPRQHGFLYSHLGWIFAKQHDDFDKDKVADLMRYPELRWLDKYPLVPAYGLAAICFLVAGWPGLFVGFFWSTVAVYHGTFCINSLAHVHGKKRYVTGDDSRNNWLLAIFTMGEGWHNNHHAFQSSVRQGFRWYEWDPTYYILKAMSWVGLVWDLRMPPKKVVRNEHGLGVGVINRAAEQLAGHFNSANIASTISSTLSGVELDALRDSLHEALARAQDRTQDALANVHIPQMPTREELEAKANAIFARTQSLEEIVDRAYQLLLSSVNSYLAEPAKARA